MSAARLLGNALVSFLENLGIPRLNPIGRSSSSGETDDDEALNELLRKGDPLEPTRGHLDEDEGTIQRLLLVAGANACLPLTPDGHLSTTEPVVFEPTKAANQVIALMEADIAAEDREEALTATWVGLAYHNHDHPADFGGLVADGADAKPRCCYLDVKRTLATTARRAKLEQRAQERKFGLMAQTVTRAAQGGFLRYPGWGKPGLIVTMLHSVRPVQETQTGFAFNWFFGIASNYPASGARWGWGGPHGVRLPEGLRQPLLTRQTRIQGVSRTWWDMLAGCEDYAQFRSADGTWDRESLQSTLEAMAFASRYLLMNENVLEQAESSVAHLQSDQVETPLSLEDFHPGESFAVYYGKKADKAIRELREAKGLLDMTKEELQQKLGQIQQKDNQIQQKDNQLQQKDSQLQQKDSQLQQKDSQLQQKDSQLQQKDSQLQQVQIQLAQNVARRRLRGHADEEIAEDMGYGLEEFRKLFPKNSS